MKRITIQDIATELKMSRNTISKALSDSDTVAGETKDLIVKKAIDMGYPSYKIKIPENLVGSITQEQKKKILIISRRETANFWNRMIVGISDVINEKQDSMQLHIVSKEDERDNYISPELLADIDGIIVMSVFEQVFVERLMTYNVPVVFFDSPTHSEEYLKYGDVIMPEGWNSMRQLVNSLIKQGLKRLSFLGDITYCRSMYDRYMGYCAALAENNLPIDSSMQFTKHVTDRYYTRDEVQAAINNCSYTPDAFVCANDDIAIYAYGILKDRGISVPKDVAITGFDNTEMAEVVSPGLTTAAVHTQTMGRRLATQLYHRMKRPGDAKELIAVSTDIIYRESSKRRKLF